MMTFGGITAICAARVQAARLHTLNLKVTWSNFTAIFISSQADRVLMWKGGGAIECFVLATESLRAGSVCSI
jgi:hypothetical protein